MRALREFWDAPGWPIQPARFGALVFILCGIIAACSYSSSAPAKYESDIARQSRECEGRGGKPVIIVGNQYTVICFAPEVLR